MLLYLGSGGNTLCGDIQSIPRYFPSQLVKAPTAMGLLLCQINFQISYTQQ